MEYVEFFGLGQSDLGILGILETLPGKSWNSRDAEVLWIGACHGRGGDHIYIYMYVYQRHALYACCKVLYLPVVACRLLRSCCRPTHAFVPRL